ncbi:hypothetical protein IJH89_00135, partial [Candidatus Saccharibacteria bacterium]|nr:hypothetical protein [Candidatus Saccharibacteria bacterium]
MYPQQQPAPQPAQQPAAPGAITSNPSQNPGTQPSAPIQATPDTPLSTQTTLLISERRDGMVIMKDGSFRAVIACQS